MGQTVNTSLDENGNTLRNCALQSEDYKWMSRNRYDDSGKKTKAFTGEGKMRRTGKLTIVTILLCVVIIGSMMFPLLNLDLSTVVDSQVPFFNQLQDVSGILGSSDTDVNLKVAGKDVLISLAKKADSLGSIGKELLLFLRMLVLIPVVCAVLLLLLSFFRRTWAKVLSLLLSGAGFISVLLGLVWVFPDRLSRMITDTSGDTVSAVVTRITEGAAQTEAVSEGVAEIAAEASVIRDLVFRSVSPALWVIMAALLLLVIISIFRLVTKESSNAGSNTDIQPAFSCTDGPLAGETIPIREKDEISIGSSPSNANLVIERKDIAPCHCRISFRQESGKYCVMVYENAPVLLNGKRLRNGENEVKRGSDLILGTGDCSIHLV